MFKKLLILVVLGAVLVAVSYYKTTLQDKRLAEARTEGEQWADHTVANLKKSQDSLATELDSTSQALAGALAMADTVRIAETDSLKRLIVDQEQKIADLTPAKTPTKTATAKKTDATSQKHKEILAYYKKRYQNLPNDLSAYERRVALSEIREESADKFKISVSELNRIRKAYKLSY